jgi:hypothetical protein
MIKLYKSPSESYTTGFERSHAEDKLSYNVTLLFCTTIREKWQREREDGRRKSGRKKNSFCIALASFVAP